jgi:rare lipoprotein A
MHIRKLLVAAAILAAPFAVSAAGGGRDLGSGHASYYGNEFAGRRTANGEIFNPNAMTAAHRTVAFGSKVKVTHLGNGREVTVRINDRGPWGRKGRVIDLSHAAAKQIGMHHSGTAKVRLTLLSD